jgi:hypothetical protein
MALRLPAHPSPRAAASMAPRPCVSETEAGKRADELPAARSASADLFDRQRSVVVRRQYAEGPIGTCDWLATAVFVPCDVVRQAAVAVEMLTADEGYEGLSSAGESSSWARWRRTRSLRAASMSSSAGVSRSMKFRRTSSTCPGAASVVGGMLAGFPRSRAGWRAAPRCCRGRRQPRQRDGRATCQHRRRPSGRPGACEPPRRSGHREHRSGSCRSLCRPG